MSQTMALFRRHQRKLLAIFGVALILVFTVGSIVSQYLELARANSANTVVVSLTSGDLRESDLQNMRNSRQMLRRFMRTVNLAAAEKGATPKRYLGILDRDDEQSLVQTAILAKRASELGIEVSDESIVRFLERYSEGTLQKGDFATILLNTTQGYVTQGQFFDAMRREMLTLRFMDLFQRGITPATPSATWDYFERINRRINFEAVPFEAADYLARVAEPSEAEITALFEEGKERYPRPDQPEAGFKRLKKVAVQYVKGDLEDFMVAAKASITDEQIRAYYDSHKEEFRRIALPNLNPSGASPGAGAIPGIEGAGAAPATTPGATDSGFPVPETDSTPATPPAGTIDLNLPESTEPKTQPLQDDPSDSGPKVNTAPEGEAAVAAEEPVAEEPAAQAATPEEPVSTTTTEAAPVETPAAETPAAETTPGAEPPANSETEDVLNNLPEAAGGNAEAAGSTYKSLEEVSEDIRAQLANPIARGQLENSLNAVRSAMRSYYTKWIGWETSGRAENKPQPVPPDIRALAAQNGLTMTEVPLVNVFQLQETDPVTAKPIYEISQAFDMNFIPFAQHAFASDLRLFEVRSIRGYLLDTEFLFWKTNEQLERLPELAEVRDEVVRTLKIRKAIELAKEDAKRAAEELTKSGQSPSIAYRNDPNRKVITAESVTWMTSSNVPEMPPRPTRIPGIQYPGSEFMRTVFNLDANQANMAVDNPQDTAYAVFVTKVDTTSDELRTRFAAVGPTNDTVSLAMNESREAMSNWYINYEKELKLKWKREPLPDSQSR